MVPQRVCTSQTLMKTSSEISFPWAEEVLHRIWKEQLISLPERGLLTECGKPVSVLSPGRLNPTDGPDFSEARLLIDGLRWFGSVEIHTRSRHWKQHAHHTDPGYNRVILHVVAEKHPEPVYCSDQSSPYTLNLLNYLHPELYHFLRENKSGNRQLPCSGLLNNTSGDAFRKQILKAHREYFDIKIQDMLQYFDPRINHMKAWQHALVLSLFNGLGIPHNREAMTRAGRYFLDLPDSLKMDTAAADIVPHLNNQPQPLPWKLKGSRPAHHPANRLPEAIKLSQCILRQPAGYFSGLDALQSWHCLLRESGIRPTDHYQRLYGIVFLPAVYLLGTLSGSEILQEKVFNLWIQLESPVPKPVYSRFKMFEGSRGIAAEKLGAVHQLRSYCRKERCFKCFVLKSAIRS